MVGLLCGGDYDEQRGATGVDSALAFPAVRKLMSLLPTVRSA